MTRVLLVDDQAMIRAGIRMILESTDDIVVVSEAGDGEAAILQARAARPDVILMDVQMPILDGGHSPRHRSGRHPRPGVIGAGPVGPPERP